MNSLDKSELLCGQSPVPSARTGAGRIERLAAILSLVILAPGCAGDTEPGCNEPHANPAAETAIAEPSTAVEPADNAILASPAAEKAIAELSGAIQSDDRTVRRSAVEDLGKIGPPAVPVLAAALNKKPASFGNTDRLEDENKALLKLWMEMAAENPNLAGFPSDHAVPSPFFRMVGSGWGAPGMLSGFSLEMLWRTDLDGRRQVAETLGAIGTDALPHLMQAVREDVEGFQRIPDLDDLRYDSLLRGWHLKRVYDDIKGLARIGPEAIPFLKKVLADQDEGVSVRLVAAAALGEMGAPALSALSEELYAESHDEGHTVHETVVEALGRIGEAAVPALSEALQKGPKHVRRSAAEQLGEIGSEKALPSLIAAVRDRDEFTRCKAAEAIGKTGARDTEARSALGRLLSDPNEMVRQKAAEVLGKRGRLLDEDYPFP